MVARSAACPAQQGFSSQTTRNVLKGNIVKKIALALVAASALGLVACSESASTNEAVENAMDAANQAAEDVQNAASEMQDAAANMTDAASNVADAAGDAAVNAADATADAAANETK